MTRGSWPAVQALNADCVALRTVARKVSRTRVPQKHHLAHEKSSLLPQGETRNLSITCIYASPFPPNHEPAPLKTTRACRPTTCGRLGSSPPRPSRRGRGRPRRGSPRGGGGGTGPWGHIGLGWTPGTGLRKGRWGASRGRNLRQCRRRVGKVSAPMWRGRHGGGKATTYTTPRARGGSPCCSHRTRTRSCGRCRGRG